MKLVYEAQDCKILGNTEKDGIKVGILKNNSGSRLRVHYPTQHLEKDEFAVYLEPQKTNFQHLIQLDDAYEIINNGEFEKVENASENKTCLFCGEKNSGVFYEKSMYISAHQDCRDIGRYLLKALLHQLSGEILAESL